MVTDRESERGKESERERERDRERERGVVEETETETDGTLTGWGIFAETIILNSTGKLPLRAQFYLPTVTVWKKLLKYFHN